MATDTQTGQGQSSQGIAGAVRNVASFHNPMLAMVQGSPTGETVNIIACGDVEGHSPAYLVVDASGQTSWQSQRNVTVIDPRYLPAGQNQLRGFQKLFGGSR